MRFLIVALIAFFSLGCGNDTADLKMMMTKSFADAAEVDKANAKANATATQGIEKVVGEVQNTVNGVKGQLDSILDKDGKVKLSALQSDSAPASAKKDETVLKDVVKVFERTLQGNFQKLWGPSLEKKEFKEMIELIEKTMREIKSQIQSVEPERKPPASLSPGVPTSNVAPVPRRYIQDGRDYTAILGGHFFVPGN